MKKELHKFRRRKNIIKEFDRLEDERASIFIIHYSCESFYDIQDGRTPRITSIAIRNYATGQTKSFSIHCSAEILKIHHNQISSEDLNRLEKHLLDDFFASIANIGSMQNVRYVHWNMRDNNYGFSAIEHRYRILEGTPYIIPDDRKFDLARALYTIYGSTYAPNKPNGRLHNLCEQNHVTKMNLLTGKEEAEAFSNKEFTKLHLSTLRKVDIIATILEKTIDGTLKTKASWKDQYMIYPAVILDFISTHWLFKLLVILVSLYAGYKMFF